MFPPVLFSGAVDDPAQANQLGCLGDKYGARYDLACFASGLVLAIVLLEAQPELQGNTFPHHADGIDHGFHVGLKQVSGGVVDHGWWSLSC